MQNKMRRSTRSVGQRVLLTSVLALCVGAFAVACGDDADDDDNGGLSSSSGTGGTNSGSGGTNSGSGSGSGGTVVVGNGGDGGSSDCGESSVDAGQIPVNILLVVDQSQSMVDNDIGSVTRWKALQDALSATLDATQDSLSYGLKLFPGDNSCGVSAGVDVEVGPGSDTAADIVGALDGTPDGATPTAAALQEALEYFTDGPGADLTGEKYVLLATDGGPNCDEDDAPCGIAECTLNIDEQCPLEPDNCCAAGYDALACLDEDGAVAAVEALAEAGIKTIVVGIPGTEEYEGTLSAMADVGGMPNTSGDTSYYAVDENGGTEGLTDALLSITQGLIKTCEFKLEEQPPDLNLLNVEIDGVKIDRVVGGGDEGWDYADESESPPTVVLQGSTCEQVETEGAQSVSIVYGCPTQVPR